MVKRKLVAATSPDILVEVNGDTYNIKTVTSVKTVEVTFTLGKEYEADPGTDRTAKYVTTLEGGDTLKTVEVANPENVATRKFTDDGLVMTVTAKGVTGSRTFKRA